MNTVYAVICGESWEDIYYFHSYTKARENLVIQTVYMRKNNNNFHPFIVAYEKANHGEIHRTMDIVAVTDLASLFAIPQADLVANPSTAFHLIHNVL